MGNYGSGPIKVLAIDYHRNGVGGTGFYVVLFTIPNNPYETMLAVSFEREDAELKQYHEGEIAILSVEKLADKNIEFRENSYRYEFFEKEIKKAIKEFITKERERLGIE